LQITFLAIDDISVVRELPISPLKGLTKLKSLFLTGNPVSDSQIEELKKALPDTDIYTGR